MTSLPLPVGKIFNKNFHLSGIANGIHFGTYRKRISLGKLRNNNIKYPPSDTALAVGGDVSFGRVTFSKVKINNRAR